MAENDEIKNNSEEPLLTEKETWSVIEFARSMSGMYGNVYLNPDLVSGRMRDVTLNPMQATQDMLDAAMRNPKESERQIQEFSQSFELTSMVYKRLLSYLGDMLSFDITYTSTAEADDYDAPKYKKDLAAVEKFLNRFEYRKEFRSAVKEMLRNDAFFACFVDTGDKFVLQELPSEYCKITGRWDGGFLFSFNMYWFIQPGVDIDMYPDFFKKKFNEIWKNANITRSYDPALPPEKRDKSSWIYWVDVPTTIGVCFKFTPELATRLPYFTPLFSDLILQGLMRNLQKNSNMAAASRLIMGEVPMLNKDAKSTVKDTIGISPDLLGKFMALVRSAISDSIRVASAPLQNIKAISFDADNSMYDSYVRTTLGMSGINTNLIFTSNIKPNAIETQLSLNVDEQMMTILYDQFNDFMNYWVNKFTKTYHFRFVFEGTDFYLNRAARLENAMTLFSQGIVLPQKIAAAMGMKPADLIKHMAEAKSMDFMSMLTVPSVLNQEAILGETAKDQQDLVKTTAKLNPKPAPSTAKAPPVPKVPTAPTTGKPDTGMPAQRGRPTKSDSKISDEGEQTRAQGTNIGRGGKAR
jgi:hypothetical protein